MIHARKDYQLRWPADPALTDHSLIAEGSTPIAADEPVMLFRAQDRHFVAVLECYQERLAMDPDTKPDIADALREHIVRAEAWQAEHGCKTPDLPTGMPVQRDSSEESRENAPLPEVWDKEDIYDAEISPLMTQIIAICKRAKIPYIASFQYAANGPDDADVCTSCMLPAGTASGLRRAHGALFQREPMFAITISRREE